jgi:hypothetical protein
MHQKEPNKSPVFRQFFGRYCEFAAVLLAYLYTDSQTVSDPIHFRQSVRFSPFSRVSCGFAILAFTRFPKNDIWGLCLSVNRKN